MTQQFHFGELLITIALHVHNEEYARLQTAELMMTTRGWKWTTCLSLGIGVAYPYNGILHSWENKQTNKQWGSWCMDMERAWRCRLSEKSLEQNSVCYMLLCIKRKSSIMFAVSLPEELIWKDTDESKNPLRQTGRSWAGRWIGRELFYCLSYSSYF